MYCKLFNADVFAPYLSVYSLTLVLTEFCFNLIKTHSLFSVSQYVFTFMNTKFLILLLL